MSNPARLRWRCRRGTRELDILLSRFLDAVYPTLSGAEQQAFEALLEQQDPDLSAWLLGSEQPPEQWHPIIAKIQDTIPAEGL